jgi:hypothetical protein
MKAFHHFIALFLVKTPSNYPENIRNLTRISFTERQEPVSTISLPIFHVSLRVPDTISLITQTRHNNTEIIDINSSRKWQDMTQINLFPTEKTIFFSK